MMDVLILVVGVLGVLGGTAVDARPLLVGEGRVSEGSCDGFSEPLPPGTHYLEIHHDGYDRTYSVHISSKTEPGNASALVFDLHGYLDDGDKQNARSNFRDLADEENFVVVHPVRVFGSWLLLLASIGS